ncbi:MAG: hypothetical protein R2695_10620 [Acidimicrobiales bacterium]
MGHLDASPTPYHAVQTAAELLTAAGFAAVEPGARYPRREGYLRQGGALVAWYLDPAHTAASGLRVIGAHTDSPNLRIKPQPDVASAGWAQLGVEVYGGVLLNSWLDRDLGLAGRVAVRTSAGPELRLVRDDRPLLRVPQLAIHLDREISETSWCSTANAIWRRCGPSATARPRSRPISPGCSMWRLPTSCHGM